MMKNVDNKFHGLLQICLRRSFKRIYWIIIICVSVFLLINFFSARDNLDYNSYFDYECIENGSQPFPETVHLCIQGPQIFFLETSGASALNARQACAVESTARHNPSMRVSVLMTNPQNINHSHPVVSKLKSIPNIQFTNINIDVFVHGSPVWNWLRAGKWKKSQWKVSHLSDALRFLLIWRYGGMYLDMDIVSLRSMEHLKNSIITEDWDRVAAGILIFDKGHKLMEQCMLAFVRNYDPYNFVNNGPGVVTRSIKNYCDIENIGKVSGATCDLDILPPEAAFPIPYDKWEKYFVTSSINMVSNYFNSSYLIHVWNKYSKFYKLKIGTHSLYELAMEQHCPFTHEYAGSIGYI